MNAIDNWLARKPLESMAEMPDMLIVGSLEDAARLRQKYGPLQRLVIFFPAAVQFHRERRAPLAYLGHAIWAVRVDSKTLAANMARLYFRGSSSSELTQAALKNLENEVRDASARRSEEMDRLWRSAQGFGVEPPPSMLGDFVKHVISSQFEFPEVLIREAVQNADGSWEEKLKNRIDVVLDAASRTITVTDQGCGMSTEVVESAFFNLYASLNEHLEYAAGKFGLGTASFFGADHEQVVLDTRTRGGAGAYVVVDSDLNRVQNQPPRRLQAGTTLSIKLKASSPIDFVRLETVLRNDCAYLETPLYLHKEGNTEQINIPLLPNETADTARIAEPHIQGHLRRCEGPGVLHILCHRIRLTSIPTVGYTGAIDCPALETTFSRDSVMDNPILRQALEVVRLTSERLLRPATMDVAALSVRSRARLYRMFVMTHLLQDGIANESFCRRNLGELMQWHIQEPSPKSLLSGAFYAALCSPLVVARCIQESSPVSAALETLRSRFRSAERGGGGMAALPLFLLGYLYAMLVCVVLLPVSMPLPLKYSSLAAAALVPLWGLEIFVRWALESFMGKAARWTFHRALRKEGDWFRRPASALGTLKNAAILAFILSTLWLLACELSALVPSGSLSSLPGAIARADVQSIEDLGSYVQRIPWPWPGGALAAATLLLAFMKWRFRRKLQFGTAPHGPEQQALIDHVQQIVGANVSIGYSRGLTPLDAKAYIAGQRICLNPCRFSDLNAQQIAFCYDVGTRGDYSQASKAAVHE